MTANAPDGVLHELFFDPVTIASAVAADTANGVLKPASFTDAIGATTTIERIAWEAGTVSIELSPHTGVAGHAVDFIALDGSVSLSLDVADATVDAANNTLSWPVASQPWRSGDKLMVRIREAPDCSTGAVTDTSANPGLARDCEVLLLSWIRSEGPLLSTGTSTTIITAWDGVTVSGTPSRVTRLELANEGLDGSIPEYLGRLLGLTHLDLSRNSLTGAIPFELGRPLQPGGAPAIGKQPHRLHPRGADERGDERSELPQPTLLPSACAGEPHCRHISRKTSIPLSLGRGGRRRLLPRGVQALHIHRLDS